MYEKLASVTLRTGERVELGLIVAPDSEWAERVEALLGHKGGDANWQNSEFLRSNSGVEAYYYVLHRDGVPFSNVMSAELGGVGIFGHVWTNPEDRRKGAISRLMEVQMEHFRRRGGKALYLGTEFDSPAYHIYRKEGFESVEAASPYMEYYSSSKKEFEAWYFAKGETHAVDVRWRHWASTPALFIGDYPGLVRCVPQGLIGRASSEAALLRILREGTSRRPRSGARVLEQTESTAVVGMAAWGHDLVWPNTCLIDVYCHPAYWDQAGPLLSSLVLPEADRYLAYVDAAFVPKYDALTEAGFRESATLAGRVAGDSLKTHLLDVVVLEKTHYT